MRCTHLTRTALAIGLLALVGLASACGSGDDSPGQDMGSMMNGAAPAGSIRVDLVNWAVQPAETSTKAGRVTFWAVHDMSHAHGGSEGGATHDLQVMKKNADGSLQMAGQVQGLKMGEAKALTLTLTPGEYELSCNVVEEVDSKALAHYAMGMRTPFTVTG